MKIFLDANICLDLLDTTRANASQSVQWYLDHKDDTSLCFYFSGDFITTFYYILTQKKKLQSSVVISAIDALCTEITPIYLQHNDFLLAKQSFTGKLFDDFEDLMILHSALRVKSQMFITNDKDLINIKSFDTMKIISLRKG